MKLGRVGHESGASSYIWLVRPGMYVGRVGWGELTLGRSDWIPSTRKVAPSGCDAI
ncbi:MAG: hypothetical protein AB1Z31_26600 [Desulfobacterales bacterium]